MQWMLLVDTCGAQGSIGLARLDNPLVCVAERTLPGRETQERLMTAIPEVLDEAGVSVGEISAFAVVTGPGSFTGVRIGLAAVKGFAEALGKPFVALSRLAVLAAQAKVQGSVQAWVDAGRGEVFVGRYQDGICLSERIMRAADAVSAVPRDEPVIVMEDQLRTSYPAARLVASVGVREALPLAWVKASAGQFTDTAFLDANYLRVPDAELARLSAEAMRQGEAAGAPS